MPLLLASLQCRGAVGPLFCSLVSVVVCNTSWRRNITHQGQHTSSSYLRLLSKLCNFRDGGPVVLRPIRATPCISIKLATFDIIYICYKRIFKQNSCVQWDFWTKNPTSITRDIFSEIRTAHFGIPTTHFVLQNTIVIGRKV